MENTKEGNALQGPLPHGRGSVTSGGSETERRRFGTEGLTADGRGSAGRRMADGLSRRGWLGFASLGVPLSMAAAPGEAAVPAGFPTQPPDLVREMVTVAHGNLRRVRELVEDR